MNEKNKNKTDVDNTNAHLIISPPADVPSVL